MVLGLEAEERDMIARVCSSHKPASLFFNTSNITYKQFKELISSMYNITLTIDISDDLTHTIKLNLTKFKNLIEVKDTIYINPDEQLSVEMGRLKIAVHDLNDRYDDISNNLEDTKKRMLNMANSQISTLFA